METPNLGPNEHIKRMRVEVTHVFEVDYSLPDGDMPLDRAKNITRAGMEFDVAQLKAAEDSVQMELKPGVTWITKTVTTHFNIQEPV